MNTETREAEMARRLRELQALITNASAYALAWGCPCDACTMLRAALRGENPPDLSPVRQ